MKIKLCCCDALTEYDGWEYSMMTLRDAARDVGIVDITSDGDKVAVPNMPITRGTGKQLCRFKCCT